MSPQNLSHYRAYAQATHTVAKTRQVVMLYDAVIRNLRQAREAILAKRFEERFNLLSKASEILVGLQGALDFEKGGAMSQTLYEFYGSMETRITRIQRSNRVELCDEIAVELKEMRDAWDSVDRQQTKEAAPAPMAIDPAMLEAGVNDRAMALTAITA